MKKLWKIYDFSLVAIFLSVILCIITCLFSKTLALVEAVSILILVILKYKFYKNKKSKLHYQIHKVSDELDFEQGKAFENLSVACAVVEENGNFVWLNDKFAQTFSLTKADDYSNIKQLLRKNSLEKVLGGYGTKVRIDNLYFSVYSSPVKIDDETIYLLYFFDETKLRITEREYYDSRPSIMLTVIDNADEIYQEFKESECASIFSYVEQLLDDWAASYGALCRKYSNARMLIFVEEKGLQRMIADKFNILDKIREYTFNGKNTDITLSIGVGKEENLNDSNNSARQALDMAQSRGGDQVAVKHEAQYKFYGGVTAGHEKKNKVRTRLISKAIAEIINGSENVIIMGHRFSDFDAFGAAFGMYTIARYFGKKASVCIDLKTSLATPLVEKVLEETNDQVIATPEYALSQANENTLLIIVDTHRKDFTECPQLLDSCGKVVVIDHHRKAVDFIENTEMFYHMPNASSACEMVAEISQYIDSKGVVSPVSATAMLSGIMLDTRNFIIRAGVRTFEAAAFLKSRGANTVECKKLFSNDMDVFRHRNAIIDQAETYSQCAVSCFSDEVKNIRLVTSQAADEMINIDGVKAAFVIYDNGNSINISGRSYGEINVQLVMEHLGGGGHQTMAACQLEDITIDEAKSKLYKAIDNYFSNL